MPGYEDMYCAQNLLIRAEKISAKLTDCALCRGSVPLERLSQFTLANAQMLCEATLPSLELYSHLN